MIETRRYNVSSSKLFALEQSIFDLLEDHPAISQRSYQREPLVRSSIIHQIHKLGERLEDSRKCGNKNEILDEIINNELNLLAIMMNDYEYDVKDGNK